MPDRRHPPGTLARLPGPIACASIAAAALAAPGIVARPAVQWAPWLVGLFAFGIPHGALDHLVGGAGGRPGVRFFAAYLGLIAAMLAAWWLAPMAALVGFLATAAYHFGQGDAYWESGRRRGAGLGPRPAWRSAPFLIVRGVLPVALPVLVFGDEFAEAADAMAARLFGGSGRWSIPDRARSIGLAAIAAAAALQAAIEIAAGWRGPSIARRYALAEAAETAALAAAFVAAPPVLAMGVYFNVWHSIRHVARLIPEFGPTRESASRGRWAEAMARFYRAAMPTTLAALGSMAALGWLVRGRAGEAADFGLAALVMVSALTLPHVMVVIRMDRSARGAASAGGIP